MLKLFSLPAGMLMATQLCVSVLKTQVVSIPLVWPLNSPVVQSKSNAQYIQSQSRLAVAITNIEHTCNIKETVEIKMFCTSVAIYIK